MLCMEKGTWPSSRIMQEWGQEEPVVKVRMRDIVLLLPGITGLFCTEIARIYG